MFGKQEVISIPVPIQFQWETAALQPHLIILTSRTSLQIRVKLPMVIHRMRVKLWKSEDAVNEMNAK
jgi:hypothetical protein